MRLFDFFEATGGRRVIKVMDCTVQLTPADASPTWVSAVHDVQTRLRLGAGDCARIEVKVHGEGALVVFTTRDGRFAGRDVASLTQLGATVDALVVTWEIPSTPPPSPTNDRIAAPPSTQPVHVLVALLGGGRLAAPSAFISPSVDVHAGITFASWELALVAHGEPTLAWLDGATPQGFSRWRYAIGASFARRQPLARAAVLLLGVGASMSVIGQDEIEPTMAVDSRTFVEPSAGAFVGVVFPQQSRLRVRSELGADFTLARVYVDSDQQTNPPLPWFSAGLSIGLEGDLR